MSVVLLGMEMPRECEHCQLADPAWIGFCRIEKRFWNPDPGQPLRPGWCPLRPLPVKHGRLGDLDEIKNKLAKDKREAFTKHDVWLMLSRYGADTIVEAEGDK